jgi:signal transduction histidine kinase
MLIAMGAGVALLAAVAILLVERARRGRVTRQLQDVAGRLVGAQEAERGRIARELHDDAIQRLALLAIQLDRHGGPPGSPDDWPRRLADAVRSLAADLGALGSTLYPARLPHVGVAQAVRDLGRNVTDHHAIRVTVEEDAFPEQLEDAVGLVLYRIAQEALQNVVRHSGAREARVTLRGGPDFLSMEITDDGTGIPASAVPGIGLTSMRERAASLGARLSVDRARGGGTRVRVRLARHPVPAGAR